MRRNGGTAVSGIDPVWLDPHGVAAAMRAEAVAAWAEAEHLRAEVADRYDSIARARALLDEKRQRIAELEGLLAMRRQA
jgi:hypothetical protein